MLSSRKFEIPTNFRVSDLLSIIVIIGISFLFYSRALNLGFFCDDNIFIEYAYRAESMNFGELLWNCFCTSSQELYAYQLAYRPLAILWFVAVYKTVGLNTVVLHSINLLLHSLCAVLVYLISKLLIAKINESNARLTGLCAALLFVAYPLHGEVVNWITEQIDLLCFSFYLIALFFFFVSTKTKRILSLDYFIQLLSVLFFLLAMFTKEHGITIPLLATLYYALYSSSGSARKRLLESLKATRLYWICLVVYFVFRTQALGTPIGGYYGALEEGFDIVLWKWQHGHGLWQLLFPINRELMPGPNFLYFAFVAIMFLLAVHIGETLRNRAEAKQLENSLQKQLYLFLLAWTIICFLPPAIRWMIEPSLAGSRHVYLCSVPVFIFLACLIVNPITFSFAVLKRRGFNHDESYRNCLIPLFLLLSTFCLFKVTTGINNEAWNRADALVKNMKKAVVNAVYELDSSKKLVLLTVPSQYLGVHLFYHWDQLKNMFKPPFNQVDLSSRIDVPSSHFFLHSQMISNRRLRQLKPRSKFYYWDSESNCLKVAKLPISEKEFLDKPLKNIDKNMDDRIEFNFICQDPKLLARADLVELKLKCSHIPGVKATPTPYFALGLKWQTPSWTVETQKQPIYIQLFDDGKWHTYHFQVSEYKHWLLSKHTGLIRISCSNNLAYELGQAKLIDEKNYVPRLDFIGNAKQVVQTYKLDKNEPCKLAYDAKSIESVDHVMLEISYPSFLFQAHGSSLRESVDRKPKVMKRLRLAGLVGKVSVPAKEFSKAASYQLRLSAQDKNDRRVGYYSDPVDIVISPALW